MKFYSPQLYHIYNQGNNQRKIFYNEENYIFFLWKMRAHLLPFGDLVAYCLMPNHYHWLFYLKKVKVERSSFREHILKINLQRFNRIDPKKEIITSSPKESVLFNNEIGKLQSSYTRAINKEMGWTGSLFRKNFKAKDGWIDDFITLNNTNKKLNYQFLQGNDYAYKCLTYIHDNPVSAGLVTQDVDWIFSSARDYKGLRNGSLCNLELGKKIINEID